MLADPRADAFVSNFAGQWLHLRNLKTIAPNHDEFPDFDDTLREAFQREAELFFAHLDRARSQKLFGDHNFVFSSELQTVLGLAKALADRAEP